MSCRRCRSCRSVNNIPKLTIPLPLCFYSQSLKPADTPSRFTPLPLPFLIIIFWVFGSLLLSRSVSVSHTLRTGELKQWQLQQTLRLCGPLHSQKRLRNLLQHDRKIFEPCFIVLRTVPPMLSEILSVKIQWMTQLMNETTVIKVLLSHNYSNCSLSSLFIFISNSIYSCSSKLSSLLLFIQISSNCFSSSLWNFPHPISFNACDIRPLT